MPFGTQGGFLCTCVTPYSEDVTSLPPWYLQDYHGSACELVLTTG
jgi:hypothetical protein